MTKNTQEIAIDALIEFKERSERQKETSFCSVVIKQGEVQRVAAKFNYMDRERLPKLQQHELEKELYLREMREKLTNKQ